MKKIKNIIIKKMKFIQLKIVPFFRKNIEIVLLIFLLVISVFITQLYNTNAKKSSKRLSGGIKKLIF